MQEVGALAATKALLSLLALYGDWQHNLRIRCVACIFTSNVNDGQCRMINQLRIINQLFDDFEVKTYHL